jgi:lipoate-protein ligase A
MDFDVGDLHLKVAPRGLVIAVCGKCPGPSGVRGQAVVGFHSRQDVPMQARLVRESFPSDPALEAAVAVALLGRAAEAGEATLRLYRPGPTVAFGRLDTLRPGFAAATEAARAHGFTPVVRAPGGHAAAFHQGCLGVDLTMPDGDPITGMQDRFAETGDRLAAALRTLGVDARVGEVPGEYCPGRFSVNARGRVKLVGTAQRVVRRAHLFAAMIVVTDPAPIEAVLVDVYAALELEFDPTTAGAVCTEVAGVTVDDVERAVLIAYDTHPAELDSTILAAARAAIDRHRV